MTAPEEMPKVTRGVTCSRFLSMEFVFVSQTKKLILMSARVLPLRCKYFLLDSLQHHVACYLCLLRIFLSLDFLLA